MPTPTTVKFGSGITYPTGNWPHAVAVVDVNGDGNLDLVTPNEFSGSISVLLGNGSGSFSSSVSYASGPSPQGIATGDFNKDENRISTGQNHA